MNNLTTTYTDNLLTGLAGWNQAAREMVSTYADYPEVRTRKRTAEMFDRAHTTLTEHDRQLHLMVTRRGTGIAEELKTTVGGLLGSLRGLVGKARSRVGSSAVADLHLFLNRLSLGYLELHAHGLALSDVNATQVAVDHYRDLQSLLAAASEELLFLYHAESAAEHLVGPRYDLVEQAAQAVCLIRKEAEHKLRN